MLPIIDYLPQRLHNPLGDYMPTAYHMVHYRRFGSDPSNSKKSSFESLCRRALDKLDPGGKALWTRVQDRIFELGDAEGRQIPLNRVADLSTAVFGEMCLAHSRGLQALLDLQANEVKLSDLTVAQVFNLDESFAPKGSRFVRGILYWMAIGDHVLFVKMQSMTAELLQQYFEWLLKAQSAVLPDDREVTFQAEFDRSQLSGDIGDIRSLRVSGNALPHLAVVSSHLKPQVRATTRKIADRSYILKEAQSITEAIFGKKRTDALVESLGPEEYLAVDASVKVRGTRTEESRAEMKRIANEIAGLTDAKVQVEGKDGRLSGDDAILRTRMPFNLAHEASNLLEFDNAADQLQEVYSRFVRDGKIPA